MNGPCFFDPPPGDVGNLSIDNDTDQKVTVFDCDSDSCTKGINGETLAEHASSSRGYEMCSGLSVGVVDQRTGVLVGCLVEPVGEPPKSSTLIVSERRVCPAGPPDPVHPRIHDPTG